MNPSWISIKRRARRGRLMALLELVPRAEWTAVDPHGRTFLHYAAYGDNVAAATALLRFGLDVNSRSSTQRTPAHAAAYTGQARVLRVLCAWGADVHARNALNITPFEQARGSFLDPSSGCLRVLVACGVRLNARDKAALHELAAFERGVLRCRAVVVVLLGLKRRRSVVMRSMDRWVVRELCWGIWATREHAAWTA